MSEIKQASNLRIIAANLREKGQEILATPNESIPKAEPLSHLQEILEDLLLDCKETEAEFFIFFLSIFLDDFFYNFAGDIPYSEQLDNERGKLLRQIALYLLPMADSLEAGNYIECYKICVNLSQSYLGAIKHLNEVLH